MWAYRGIPAVAVGWKSSVWEYFGLVGRWFGVVSRDEGVGVAHVHSKCHGQISSPRSKIASGMVLINPD